MGSLNDYKWQGDWQRPAAAKTGMRPWLKRLLRQTALALLLFLLVIGSVQADNLLGDSSRYVLGQGVQQENSWLNLGDVVPAMAGNDASEPPATEAQRPVFQAPASGVVVRETTLAEDGLKCELGILIQGAENQTVKAAAAGEVLYLGESSGGFIIEIGHSGGYHSVYQGLSEVQCSAGSQVGAGEAIGVTANGQILFSLYADGEEIDPMDYLFNQEPI